jgi:hypothetical protein
VLQYRYRGPLFVIFSVSLLAVLILTGCGGASSASSAATNGNHKPGQLTVNPSTMTFGNVALGSSQNQAGSLTAADSTVNVSSANVTGSGYTLSGITFPVTIAAGQSVPFTVTFAPQVAGNSAGSISFVSKGANSTNTETLSGTGTQQPPGHSVSLSWDPSISSVVGYNVYRGTQAGGPYNRVNSSTQGGTTYSDGNVQAGVTYFYVVTALDASSQESIFSNETMAVIPTP